MLTLVVQHSNIMNLMSADFQADSFFGSQHKHPSKRDPII